MGDYIVSQEMLLEAIAICYIEVRTGRTLFESHLSYGIYVWGVISQTKLEPVFTVQKKCVCIMFGDNEAYFDKL